MPINFATLKSKINKRHVLILAVSLFTLAGVIFIQKIILERGRFKLPPLLLLKTEPPPGAHQTPFTASAIIFTFNEKLHPLSVSYSVSPTIELAWKFGGDQNILQFYPMSPWEANQEYKLTISKELRSLSGQKLKEDLIFFYKLVPPQDYPAW